jgi:carboxylesterase
MLPPISSGASHKPVPLLLIHGLLSSPKEFGLINHALRMRGVEPISLRIEGYTDGQARRPVSWRNWLSAVHAAIDEAVPKDRPVALGGLCSGGLLAAAVALARPERVGSVALLSPTFKYDGWGLSWWTGLRGLAYLLGLDRHISIAECQPYGVKNERIRRWVIAELTEQAQSPVGPAKLPLWAIRQTEELATFVLGQLRQIQCRTLVMHARDDELSSLGSAETAVAQIPAEARKLIVLENSYHMITIDNDRALVAEELASFVSGRGQAVPGQVRPPYPQLAARAA